MRLPFTEADYVRALRRVWPYLTERQKNTLRGIRDYHSELDRVVFRMEGLASHCGEPQAAFLSIVGAIGSLMAEHMGASKEFNRPGAPNMSAPVWYGILFERTGDSRTLKNLRIPFAKSLKIIDDLP